MSKILDSFKSKKFKYGAFFTATIIVVVGILIVINLMATKINISHDFTKDKLYSITDDTKDVLAGLEKDINIYPIFSEDANGSFYDVCYEILKDYEQISNKISVEYKDPLKYPSFVNQYAKDSQIVTGSIIVTDGENFKVISPEDLRTEQFNSNTMSSEIISIDVEPAVTNAIANVSKTQTHVIYNVSNHEEAVLPEALIKKLNSANYEFKQLDLFNENVVPDDCSILFVTNPYMDWMPEEAEKVLEYLQSGGSAMFMISPSNGDFKNLDSVIEYYGVEMGGYYVVEGNGENFRDNPTYIIPNFAETQAAKDMKQAYKVMAPKTQSVKEMELKKTSTIFEPLLLTSEKSYEKSAPNPKSIDMEEGDNMGAFAIAAAVTDNNGEKGTNTKIVVLGQYFFLDETANDYVAGGNYRFVVNAVNWTQGVENSIYIKPKSVTVEYLQMNRLQLMIMAFISLVLIPGAVFVTGIVVWFRRRNS